MNFCRQPLVNCAFALVLATLFCGALQSADTALPSSTLPDCLGVNIHFTDPQAGEMEMLADGGFKWVRMDFGWEGIEQKKGEYNFTAYERLLAALEPHHIHPVFILDYSNRFYDKGLSPSSAEAQDAFAHWAAAAVQHFQGRGIIWEMYNEPNISFWRPKPNVEEYARLALKTGKAIRDAAPGETYVGPATSEIDFKFLEACFKAGLLEYWDAVSTHPYRQNAPESAAQDYQKLRAMIARYAPKDKQIPILSGEWGYSSAWGNFDEQKQGLMLPRQWLVNISNGVRLSIWYDWHDDGTKPKDPECHFGTVSNAYAKDRQPVYEPKPAYRAAKTLTSFLSGYTFNKRLATASDDDYVLLFSKENELRLAAWTVGSAHSIVIPASAGVFAATSHLGEVLAPLTATASGLAVELTNGPVYLAPKEYNELLGIAAKWERVPLSMTLHWPTKSSIALTAVNPLQRAVRISSGEQSALVKPGEQVRFSTTLDVSRASEPQRVKIQIDVEGVGSIAQQMDLAVDNPLILNILRSSNGYAAIVENPSAEKFAGTLSLTDFDKNGGLLKQELKFDAGETQKTLSFDMAQASAQAGLRIEDENKNVLLTKIASKLTPIDLAHAESFTAIADGDSKIASKLNLTSDSPPEGPPQPGLKMLKLSYDFEAGWKFARIVPKQQEFKKIEGKPTSLGLWLYGDGNGNCQRLRFTDSSGQTFQPESPDITWTGWRYASFPLDGKKSGHWGGANDGTVHYPIQWDSLFLLDSKNREKTAGVVYLCSPTLVE